MRVLAAYLVGAIPVSNVIARAGFGRDLRDVENGTVSATNLYRIGGCAPFLLAVGLDVVKGYLGSAIVRRDGPAAAAAVVAGHNWSPFLAGAGGRGVAPAIGVLLDRNRGAAAVLGAGVIAGRIVGHTALGSLVGELAIVPALALGDDGPEIACALTVPMLLKRVLGNRFYLGPSALGVYLSRFLFDADPRLLHVSDGAVDDHPLTVRETPRGIGQTDHRG